MRDLTCRLTQPAFETRLAESRIIERNTCSLAQPPSEEARVRVRDNLTRIVECGEVPSKEFIETELIRPPYFNRAIQRCAHRDLSGRIGDIVCSHRLDEGRCRTDRVAFGASSAILPMSSKNCVARMIE